MTRQLQGVAVAMFAVLALVLLTACWTVPCPVPCPAAFRAAHRSVGDCQDRAEAYCSALVKAGYDARVGHLAGGRPPHAVAEVKWL